MRHLNRETASVAGGWDPRYAVVLAVETSGDVGAALVDTNGDGADVDLDHYLRGPDGRWVAGMSGNVGDQGSTWQPEMVLRFGRGAPSDVVQLDYAGERHAVTVGPEGWWLFVAPTSAAAGEAMPEVVRSDGH